MFFVDYGFNVTVKITHAPPKISSSIVEMLELDKENSLLIFSLEQTTIQNGQFLSYCLPPPSLPPALGSAIHGTRAFSAQLYLGLFVPWQNTTPASFVFSSNLRAERAVFLTYW